MIYYVNYAFIDTFGEHREVSVGPFLRKKHANFVAKRKHKELFGNLWFQIKVTEQMI